MGHMKRKNNGEDNKGGLEDFEWKALSLGLIWEVNDGINFKAAVGGG